MIDHSGQCISLPDGPDKVAVVMWPSLVGRPLWERAKAYLDLRHSDRKGIPSKDQLIDWLLEETGF